MASTELVTAVEAALEQEPAVNLHRFPIEVTWNDTLRALRLEGTAEDIAALRRIRQIAAAHVGAEHLHDDLHVPATGGRTDDELCEAVVRTLSGEPAFRVVSVGDAQQGAPPGPGDDQAWIAVSVSGSRVHLEGRLPSTSHRRLAEVLTWWVAGTTRVENDIEAHYEDDSDEELTDAVRMVLDKDPSLDAGRVRARALNHTVVLEGAVRSDANRSRATLDCWYIPGVEDVDNRLQVLE